MGQDKGDGFSMSGDPRLDRIQLEEHPSGSESPKRPARSGSHLSSPSLAEGNSPDPSATAWLGPGAGGNS